MVTSGYGSDEGTIEYAYSRISSKLMYKVPHGVTYNGVGVTAIGISGSLRSINGKDHVRQLTDVGVFKDETLTDYLTHMLGERKTVVYILLEIWSFDFKVSLWGSKTILCVNGYNDQAYDSKLATVEGVVCLSVFAMMRNCVDYILPMYVYDLRAGTTRSCVTELTQSHINLMHDMKYKVRTREIGELIKKTPKPEAPESDSKPSETTTP